MMVKTTLKMMLIPIPNRHPLPNCGRFLCGHLHLENHVFHDRLQVTDELLLTLGARVFQRTP